MKKILQKFFAPKLGSFNVLAFISYEFSNDSLMVEFRVGGYNKYEAESIAQNIIREFNKQEQSNVKLDKIWKVSKEMFFKSQNKPVSYYDILDSSSSIIDILKGKCKLNQQTLKQIFIKNAFSILKKENDYVLRTDAKNKYEI